MHKTFHKTSCRIKQHKEKKKKEKQQKKILTSKGAYTTSPGIKTKITLDWDNSYSMFTSKTINWSVSVVPPSEREAQVKREAEEMAKRKEEEERQKKEEAERKAEEERIECEKREEEKRIERESRAAAELKEKIEKEVLDIADTLKAEKKNWEEQAAVVEAKHQEARQIVDRQFLLLKNELEENEQLWVGNMEDRVGKVNILVQNVKNEEERACHMGKIEQLFGVLRS